MLAGVEVTDYIYSCYCNKVVVCARVMINCVKNQTKERNQISSCSSEAAGVAVAAGGQSSREHQVQRGDSLHSADTLANMLNANMLMVNPPAIEVCEHSLLFLTIIPNTL